MVWKNPKQRPAGGFTLIELLVVVAIIALLLSILLPSLQRAKQQARQLLCVTNLRTLGEAANFYGEDNQDWLPRGIQGFTGAPGSEYQIFATAVIKYLGHYGTTLDLWGPGGLNKRELNVYLRTFPQLQCPDYPDDVVRDEVRQKISNPVDYVASAFPIPYSHGNIDYDVAGGGQWDALGGWEGENPPDYISTSKLEQLPTHANPAAIIYVTEAHVSLPWARRIGPRFHHVFLTSQLPFGARPRIANDQRHPGGIDALFFDGHAETMDLHRIDVAWPNSLAKRLKWFTVMPEGYVEE